MRPRHRRALLPAARVTTALARPPPRYDACAGGFRAPHYQSEETALFTTDKLRAGERAARLFIVTKNSAPSPPAIPNPPSFPRERATKGRKRKTPPKPRLGRGSKLEQERSSDRSASARTRARISAAQSLRLRAAALDGDEQIAHLGSRSHIVRRRTIACEGRVVSAPSAAKSRREACGFAVRALRRCTGAAPTLQRFQPAFRSCWGAVHVARG